MTWYQWLIGLGGLFGIPIVIASIFTYNDKKHKEKYKWEILCDEYYIRPPR